MKRVVSVSLGSSKRDHRVKVNVLGEEVLVERVGTDGDLEKTIALVRELDGEVEAFGMGGIDRYIYAGSRRYTFRDARRIAREAVKTSIVDGSGLKNTLERKVVKYLLDNRILLPGSKILMVCAVDRFGMAEALVEGGCEVRFGDLAFALGIPVLLKSLRSLELAARILAPVVTQLPFKMLYPTGSKQEKNTPRYPRFYQWADVIAGDYHFIRKYMPEDLRGKSILTNTVTAADMEDLGRRGVEQVITTTPNLEGRSFGTNVMEALLVCLSGKQPDEMTPADYLDWLDRMGFKPRVERLSPEENLELTVAGPAQVG